MELMIQLIWNRAHESVLLTTITSDSDVQFYSATTNVNSALIL